MLSVTCLIDAQVNQFNSLVDELQSIYVSDGLVNYTHLKKNLPLLKTIEDEFSRVDVEKLDGLEQRAFYINAYNFWVINKVVSHYPLNSVMDVDNFFKDPYIPCNVSTMSLNDFERLIFNKFPEDPRLHFVLVCAANGCPNLSERAFSKDNLKTQINERTRVAIRDSKMVSIDMHEKKAYLSKIFEWYTSDFTKDKSLKEFINYYRNEDIPAGFEVVFLEYDWSLNDRK
jgi:hypothetical protein